MCRPDCDNPTPHEERPGEKKFNEVIEASFLRKKKTPDPQPQK